MPIQEIKKAFPYNNVGAVTGTITIRIPSALLKAITDLAIEMGVSKNRVISVMIGLVYHNAEVDIDERFIKLPGSDEKHHIS